MENLVANISGKPRSVIHDGREYLITPTVLIVPGVLNGSNGPLLYPPNEVSHDVVRWNMMPLTLRHPMTDGKPVSASTVLSAQGIGYIHNTYFNGKLRAESWFDVANLAKLDQTLLARVRAGQKIEVSTGLRTENEEIEGEYNGRFYKAIARNYQPDHLAVLPDDTGACSIDDGCGISVNQTINEKDSKMDAQKKKDLVDFIIANCAYCDEDDREVLNAKTDEKLVAQKESLEAESQMETAHNAATKDVLIDGKVWTWNAEKKEWIPPKKLEVQVVGSVENKAPVLTPDQVEDLAFAKQIRFERRQEAVTAITANEANKLTKEQLEKMSLDVLQSVAASLPQKERVINYSGAAGGPTQNQDQPKEESFGEFELPHDIEEIEK